jgi:uncharacterized protein (TIGR02588 family)
MVDIQHKDSRPDGDGKSKRDDQEKESPPAWEWFVAGIGALLVLACFGYLAYHAMARGDGPPAPEIRLLSVERQEGGHLIRVRVYNRSASTAEGLRLAGLLLRDGEVVERSQVVLQYLPGDSWREAGLYFRRDPAVFELRQAPQGYEVP